MAMPRGRRPCRISLGDDDTFDRAIATFADEPADVEVDRLLVLLRPRFTLRTSFWMLDRITPRRVTSPS